MAEPTKTISLYGDKVKINFWGGRYHRYQVLDNNKIIDSPISVTKVTGIIDKPALKFWSVKLAKLFLLDALEQGMTITPGLIEEAARQHTKYTAQAAQEGKIVHEWAEDHIKGKSPEIPKVTDESSQRVVNAIIGFLKWVEAHDIKFILSEEPVYSRKNKFVGTLDNAFTMGSEKHKIKHIGDFKTGNPKAIENDMGEKAFEPYSEHRYQVSAYQGAREEESKEEYGSKWITYFGKETAEFMAFEVPASEHAADYTAFLGFLVGARREAVINPSR